MRPWALLGCLAAVPFVLSNLGPPDPLPGLPRLMLWAWESPQDLRFVTPGRAGIAFLARTVWLDGRRVVSRPRMQPLRFTPGTDLMAVVRIESSGRGLPAPADAVREVLSAAELPHTRALQVDFDARQSERAWYHEFLAELRRRVPSKMPIVITALESWCDGDRWIRSLPIADATPMLFRMGPKERIPAAFRDAVCRSSVGVSMDEWRDPIPRARRLYVFQPGPWTRAAYDAAVAGARGSWE